MWDVKEKLGLVAESGANFYSLQTLIQECSGAFLSVAPALQPDPTPPLPSLLENKWRGILMSRDRRKLWHKMAVFARLYLHKQPPGACESEKRGKRESRSYKQPGYFQVPFQAKLVLNYLPTNCVKESNPVASTCGTHNLLTALTQLKIKGDLNQSNGKEILCWSI